ncbi:phage major capsid protein [Companilactobacillus ginsenosidimutans]|uniref:Phage head protein n=1 Tax=Companilactobacillus ginsenosidimutans TaxID=1007676 RepID=A0A0H4QFX9_9LACO|nr:phage major capsid protein [Companilactobacillus ginsenosidimutans]AKP66862.1 phage head protein [Companilactobacillus ginsenosidimutans]
MTLDEKIRSLQSNIENMQERKTKLVQETRALLDAEKPSDDDIKNADAKAKEVKDLNIEIKSGNETLASYKAVANDKPEDAPKPDEEQGPERSLKRGNTELRSALNTYLHTKGAVRDGLTSPDADVTIPEDIVYNPESEVKSVTDLSKLVQHFKANTASGKYPILKRATTGLVSVDELAKNPELAKPQFETVNWEVKTYRGAIPVSNESIADSAVDLLGIVSQNAQEQKINTTNSVIATALQSFTAKDVAGESVDDIKHIINVDLDPAYQKVIIASQSFYNYLDTLKDGNGQYLLQQPIVDGSPVRLLGIPVTVVEDTALGKAGEAHAWVGDIKRAIIMADRLDIQVRWVDNEIFGQYLQAATRFDVKVADEKAGYFLTQKASTPSV